MTTSGEQHPLHAIPHDLVGRAIKDVDFRTKVLGLKGDKAALNQYLEDSGYAPIGEEAFQAIKSLDLKQVNQALSAVDVRQALAG